MAFYELHDIKRDRVPYASDVYWHHPMWAPEIYNTPLMNLKYSALCSVFASCLVEPINHFRNAFKGLNLVYEWPKNTQQASIFLKESMRLPLFWSGLRKKMIYGAVQHTLDAGFKLSCLHFIFGGTWSPKTISDFNTIKYLIFCLFSGFAAGWTAYPLQVAREAYFADKTWPKDLQKGYRSPLHALFKIPFVEGPMFLFRGGLLPWFGNGFNAGMTFFFYLWLKNKLFFLWEYNDINYSFCKFILLNIGFCFGAMFGQPFLSMKEWIDKWPKERGGKNTFNTSWEAIRWVKMNFEHFYPNLLSGYFEWFKRYGAIFYISMWIADDMGLLNNNMVNPNGIETTVSYNSAD